MNTLPPIQNEAPMSSVLDDKIKEQKGQGVMAKVSAGMIGISLGATMTDSLLTSVNTAIIYKAFIQPAGPDMFAMPSVLKPYLPDVPRWVVYSIAAGVCPFLTGIVTRTIVPSVMTLNGLQYAALQAWSPIVNVGVGTMLSWALDLDVSAGLTGIKANWGTGKQWMSHLKTGITFGVANVGASFESSIIWGTAAGSFKL
jgi:hypothetical protein